MSPSLTSSDCSEADRVRLLKRFTEVVKEEDPALFADFFMWLGGVLSGGGVPGEFVAEAKAVEEAREEAIEAQEAEGSEDGSA